VKRALYIAAVLAFVGVSPRPAYPCVNGVMQHEEAIKMAIAIEQALEKADYTAAVRVLDRWDSQKVQDQDVRARLQDASYLVELRTRMYEPSRAVPEFVVKHFEVRAKAKDVRFKAWLAEAYEATGKTEEARKILEDLKRRDLMPDAFAYVTLARLTTVAADREAALASCKQRAKNKTICTVPARVAGTTTPKS
jgi:hypothetical protein